MIAFDVSTKEAESMQTIDLSEQVESIIIGSSHEESMTQTSNSTTTEQDGIAQRWEGLGVEIRCDTPMEGISFSISLSGT